MLSLTSTRPFRYAGRRFREPRRTARPRYLSGCGASAVTRRVKGATVSTGETATAMLKAILAGKDYPPEGVPDTAHNQEMWERIKREIEDLSPGHGGGHPVRLGGVARLKTAGGPGLCRRRAALPALKPCPVCPGPRPGPSAASGSYPVHRCCLSRVSHSSPSSRSCFRKRDSNPGITT